MLHGSSRLRLLLFSLLAVSVLVAAPLAGWPQTVRLPVVAIPLVLLIAVELRPWRWTEAQRSAATNWQPSSRFVVGAAVGTGLLLYWFVLTRFNSGDINAIDFTLYFDRPLYQTLHGRPLFIETVEHGFGAGGGLSLHAFWGLLPLSLLYAIHATPQWLLAFSVVCVVSGAVYTLFMACELGMSGVLAVATAFAFAFNNNTARTLNYGFHPEVMYAWFVPWMLYAGLKGRHLSFLVATVACVSVKEDAVMPIFAASAALALVRWRTMGWVDRAIFLVLPTACALANLGVYYGVVLPSLSADQPFYAEFWADYGRTPAQALVGMAGHPVAVIASVATSGFTTTVLTPYLWVLPFIGWRWLLGAAPIVLLYGASSNDQLRAFGIYYAIVLVPFLAVACSAGARTLANRLAGPTGRSALMAAALVASGTLFAGGSGGYVLRPWKAEVAAVPDALRRLSSESVIYVQSGLYPHAGYDPRVRLLTADGLRDAQRSQAIVLLTRSVSGYPVSATEIAALLDQPSAATVAPGLVAVRPADRR